MSDDVKVELEGGWDPALWPKQCPNCGNRHSPDGHWYQGEPGAVTADYLPGMGCCWNCDHPHPVLGKLRPEMFTP